MIVMLLVMVLMMMLLSAKYGDYCEGDCQKQHGVQDWKAVPLSGKNLHCFVPKTLSGKDSVIHSFQLNISLVRLLGSPAGSQCWFSLPYNPER